MVRPATRLRHAAICQAVVRDVWPLYATGEIRPVVETVLPLAQAWDLVSAGPARATGLADRGVLAQGRRADILLVDASVKLRPRLIAVISGGRLVHLTDATRLLTAAASPREAVVAA